MRGDLGDRDGLFGCIPGCPADLLVFPALVWCPFCSRNRCITPIPTTPLNIDESVIDRRPRRTTRVLRDDVRRTCVIGACQTECLTGRRGTFVSAVGGNRNRHCHSNSDDSKQRHTAKQPLPCVAAPLRRRAQRPLLLPWRLLWGRTVGPRIPLWRPGIARRRTTRRRRMTHCAVPGPSPAASLSDSRRFSISSAICRSTAS